MFLAVDSLRANHSKNVTACLKEHHDRIEIFYLSPYSPELNYDEYLNNILKGELRKFPQHYEPDDLNANIHKILMKVQKDSQK
ncbi:MAG: transposase [Deltaproteobacteria bacterium]|nr:transposase [Deltaproteobacteria bacterium]